MPLAQQGLANRRQNLIIIVEANVKGEVPINAFQRAWTIEAASTAGTNTPPNRVLRQVFHRMPGAATGQAGFVIAPRFPHARDVPQPQISGLGVNCALRDVMLNVRVSGFVL